MGVSAAGDRFGAAAPLLIPSDRRLITAKDISTVPEKQHCQI